LIIACVAVQPYSREKLQAAHFKRRVKLLAKLMSILAKVVGNSMLFGGLLGQVRGEVGDGAVAAKIAIEGVTSRN